MIAATIFVGKSMGQGNADKAKLYTIVNSVFSLVITTFLAAILYIFRENVFLIFTEVPDVLEVVRNNYIILALGMPLSSISSVLSGTMKGIGKQDIAL